MVRLRDFPPFLLAKKKKQATIFLEVHLAHCFYWIYLILEYPYCRLLYNFGLIRICARFITCHDVIDIFWRTAIEHLGHLLAPINTCPFLAICVLWRIQCKQFFTAKWSCKIECIIVELMPIDILPLRGCHMTILHYQFTHSTDVILHNNWFWATFTKFISECTVMILNSFYYSYSARRWCFIIKNC